MTHHSMPRTVAILRASLLVLATSCSASAFAQSSQGVNNKAFEKALHEGFQDNGIATVSRLKQDSAQALCSDPAAVANPKNAKKVQQQAAANLATVKYPADGKWLGDWKAGERVAQSGRGLTWSDKAGDVNGGNCYNCHQIDKKEISYGTIGPSLYNYGKIRGNNEAIVKYTWAKIYNAKAYNACSNMPRFGHMEILTEKQMQDVMALLLDPQSPVNQ